MDAVELELSLRGGSDGPWGADAILRGPSLAAPAALAADVPLALDTAALLALAGDPQAYGRALAGMLFGPPAVRSAWERARGYSSGARLPLRLRLRFHPSAAELFALRWETLADPQSGDPLGSDPRILLSRHLASDDLEPVEAPRRSALRALVAVAVPDDLAAYGLAHVDGPAEIARARAALGELTPDVLAATPQARLTAPRLIAALREGYDLVYLVCHGVSRDGASLLCLEGDDGKAAWLPGETLARAVRQLERRPLLVILAACQSLGRSHDAGSLAAIGPALARAGVVAVVAMQDNAPLALVEQLLPTFLRELLADPRADRAMALARAGLDAELPWWAPALLMRVDDGRIWVPDPAATSEAAPPRRRRLWPWLAGAALAGALLATGAWLWPRGGAAEPRLAVGLVSLAGCPAGLSTALAGGLAADPAVAVRALADPAGAEAEALDLVIAGDCADDRLALRLDLRGGARVGAVAEPARLALSASALDAEGVVELARAALAYVGGDFAGAASRFGPLVERADSEGAAALALMEGNSLLLADRPAEAVEAYAPAVGFAPLSGAALNNRGLAGVNHALALGRSGEVERALAVAAQARSDLSAAAEGEDPTLRAQARVNSATSYLLIDLDFEQSHMACEGAIAAAHELPIGYLCRAASAFWRADEQADFCAPPTDPGAIRSDLTRAEQKGAAPNDQATIAFYRTMLAWALSDCPGATDRERLRAEAATQYAAYEAIRARYPPLTTSDRVLDSFLPREALEQASHAGTP